MSVIFLLWQPKLTKALREIQNHTSCLILIESQPSVPIINFLTVSFLKVGGGLTIPKGDVFSSLVSHCTQPYHFTLTVHVYRCMYVCGFPLFYPSEKVFAGSARATLSASISWWDPVWNPNLLRSQVSPHRIYGDTLQVAHYTKMGFWAMSSRATRPTVQ